MKKISKLKRTNHNCTVVTQSPIPTKIFSKIVPIVLIPSFVLQFNTQNASAVSLTQEEDIGFLAAGLVAVGIVTGAFVTKNVIAAVSGREAKSLGSVHVDAKIIKFDIDDIDINGEVSGYGGPEPGSGNGYVVGNGRLEFTNNSTQCVAITSTASSPASPIPLSGSCEVQLTIDFNPNLYVSTSSTMTESGSASATFRLSSPQYGTIFDFSKTVKTNESFGGSFNGSYSFVVDKPTQLDFSYRVEAQATVIPEPSTILGTGVVLGAIPVLKKEYGKRNKKKDKDA